MFVPVPLLSSHQCHDDQSILTRAASAMVKNFSVVATRGGAMEASDFAAQPQESYKEIFLSRLSSSLGGGQKGTASGLAIHGGASTTQKSFVFLFIFRALLNPILALEVLVALATCQQCQGSRRT